MSRKRVTYRPNKAQATFGGIVGLVFVVIGAVVAIPTFGLFGIFWTLIAIGMTVFNFYQAFGKKYVGPEIRIEDDAEPAGSTAAHRMAQLQDLYDQGLVTDEEFQAIRQKILKDLWGEGGLPGC